jgi:hypothetical protein
MRRWAIGGVLALAAAAAGVSYAAIPGTAGVIDACAGKHSLRVVDVEAGERCTKRETALSWNQSGPKGDPGPPGPAGAARWAKVAGSGVVQAQSGGIAVERTDVGKYVLTFPADVAACAAVASASGGIAFVASFADGTKISVQVENRVSGDADSGFSIAVHC